MLEGRATAPGGPVKATLKGSDFLYEMPKTLNFEAKSDVFYLSNAAVDVMERDRKLHQELKARAAARKKKRR